MVIARSACVLLAVVSSCTAIAAFVGCAGRAPRTTGGDETRAQAAASIPTDAPAGTSHVPAEPPDAGLEPPVTSKRLAWVSPARCLTPCAYDPEASLVRVDDLGDLDPAGRHRVDREAQEPLRELTRAAHAAGHKIRIESAFRSYDDQDRVFRTMKQKGRAARPGHSEHQLGTAIDFRMPTSAAIRWLSEHAHDHGFALSYPEGKQRITGYRPEPWHVRFVGKQLANEVRTNGWSLEELFRARPDVGESGTCDECPLPASRTACGDVSDSGRCDGTVLQWCYDGALAMVDCAASKQTCGRARASQLFDCITR